jgi:hypothetical protein
LGCFFGLGLELVLGCSIFGKFGYIKGKKALKKCLITGFQKMQLTKSDGVITESE